MPFFHRSTHMRQMPPLTPDHYGGYHDCALDAYQQPVYVPANQYVTASRKDLPGVDGPEYMNSYAQLPNAPHHHSAYGRENNNLQQSSNYASLPPNSVSAFAAANAPLLPPIRIPDRSQEEHHLQSKRAQPAPQPKEEKAVGGVAAHLDYEMEQMADFVSEMAQGIVNPNTLVPPAFRKYVLQVLSSTRLPKTTILLGLYYLATRMTMLSASGRYTTGSGQVYRMLVTSLLLGSKFLDDNTFQNRSWSEVSNIPIGELNVLEIEWLVAINWNMHVDSRDPQGFKLWEGRWNIWQAKKLEISMDTLKLNPMDRSVQQQNLANPRTPPYPPPYKDTPLDSAIKEHLRMQWQSPQTNSHEQWSLLPARTDYSPPSAPETGPATPDWYSHIGGFGYGANTQIYSIMTTSLPSQSLTPAGQHSSYPSQYPPPYVPNGWNNHGIHCGCGYCLPHHDHYFMAPGFGPQPVAG